jgi:hypothetical protein
VILNLAREAHNSVVFDVNEVLPKTKIGKHTQDTGQTSSTAIPS